jgi:hypothetical protein
VTEEKKKELLIKFGELGVEAVLIGTMRLWLIKKALAHFTGRDSWKDAWLAASLVQLAGTYFEFGQHQSVEFRKKTDKLRAEIK